MAVSVDTVYQRVLALANKEQRGYITPQEFNLLANQAQMMIFEQYFHDLNQLHRNPGNHTAITDPVDIIEDKLGLFQVYNFSLDQTSGDTIKLPTDASQGYPAGTSLMYRLGDVRVAGKTSGHVTPKKLKLLNNSVFAAQPISGHPVHIRVGGGINVYETDSSGAFSIQQSGVTCDYIRVPNKVEWDYVVVNEKALYNANGSTNFDLHPSEETGLVNKILELSGIVINKPGISSYAKNEVVESANQRKS